MYEAKLSSKNQIVIPSEVRKCLDIKPGDRILLAVRGDTVILLRRPEQYSRAIRGMGEGLYPCDYLDKERESWR
jgi:AbrB family looped-hinge helix DNA binding protein